MPLALTSLYKNPLLHSYFYPGDLLVVVLKLPVQFWHENIDLKEDMDRVLLLAIGKLEQLSHDDTDLYEVIQRAVYFYQSSS